MAAGENRRGTGYSKSTIEEYLCTWDTFLADLPKGRSTPVSDIAPTALVEYRTWLLKDPKEKRATESRKVRAPRPHEGTAEKKAAGTTSQVAASDVEVKLARKRWVTAAGANRQIIAIRSRHSWLRDPVRGPGLDIPKIELRFGGEAHSAKRAILPNDMAALRAVFRAQRTAGSVASIDLVSSCTRRGSVHRKHSS